jgi:ATP-dependent Clp protease ATP-binding subunit ClpC
MSEIEEPGIPLSRGAQRILERAVQIQQERQHETLCVHHWLLALLERHGPMSESMTSGLEASSLQAYIEEELKKGETGEPLGAEELRQRAARWAASRGAKQPAERDLAAIILQEAGYPLTGKAFVEAADLSVAPATSASSDDPSLRQGGPAKSAARARRPTPTLEQFGKDLTRAARENRLSPMVGREEELDLVIETLCRRTKRNPALVGPAGVGKTTIVEGLAHRIVAGQVPEMLRDARILAIQPSTLVAGASVHGELEKRMQALLTEASQDGILLFIDEVHSIIGVGGAAGTGDIASLLKPALARGDLACIAATTDDEYRRFIEPDPALERRFQPIRVNELSPEQTLDILRALREEFQRLRGVSVGEETLRWLVDFAQRYMRNRYFPDKAVDLLEQCVAHALAQSRKEVLITDAETVAQRMVGMPLVLSDRLPILRERLLESALLSEEEITTLVNRLKVTVSGLDLRPNRPNAVALLVSEAAEHSESLSEIIAEALFQSASRVVTIDFSRFTQAHDLTMLLGAPPGYVGFSETVPLHQVAQTPWCVLRCENVDACHPQVLEVLHQALASGLITDARGKRIYLSDTVVLLTADIEAESRRKTGYRNVKEPASADYEQAAEAKLGEDFAAQIDVICVGASNSEAAMRRWLRENLLSDLSRRYRARGMEVQWDDSLIDWFLSRQSDNASRMEWERLVDEHLSGALIPYLPPVDAKERPSYVVKYRDGSVQVETLPTTERS